MPISPQKPITILLVNDHSVFCTGILAVLARAGDMTVVGEAQDGFETQKLAAKLRPQILLLGMETPGPHPIELQEWVRKHSPKTITLVLSAYDRDDSLAAMMEAGVAGYLCENEPPEQLVNAIRRAAQGEILFDQAQLARARQWQEEVESRLKQLSHRERQILGLLGKGYDNKMIAGELAIAIKTVMYHITNLLRKLGLKNRQEAALWVLKHLSDDLDKYPG
ncbi:MAG: response regulator transcription factor [Chloroflexi bacterium]|nr:response regulator transcription factor [Chloroflexota bacterium]